MFRTVTKGPVDPVFILKQKVDGDKSPEKVDLGVGVYRTPQGDYHELGAVKAAKQRMANENPGHDYEVTTGHGEFVQNATKLFFGKDSKEIQAQRVTSVQAISGTGAIHLAALFLSRSAQFKGKKVYIGTPAWGNYEPLFNLVGFSVIKYRHYDPLTGLVDFDSLLDAVRSAPAGSIFVLQGCCHNPTGADLKPEEWQQLAQVMKKQNVFPFFDMAYQGLGNSLDEDAYGLRLFAGMGFELVACQSFSKNFGLYGERCGVTHVLTESSDVAKNVYDQLRCLIRWEFSSSPAYGSRLVNTILRNDKLYENWTTELSSMQERLANTRTALYEAVAVKRQLPGNWKPILSTKGLFCFLPLTPQQCTELGNKHHIYMLQSGRINVSGLNPVKIEKLASAISEVVEGKSGPHL